MSNTNKLYHFYHIYADGQWQIPVSQHIAALKKWDLINNLAVFKVGIVGTPENRTQVIQYLINERINFDVITQQDNGWEQVTQIPLHTFALENDGYVLYAHSKGAANPEQPNQSWRKSMTYYNVGKQPYKNLTKVTMQLVSIGCFPPIIRQSIKDGRSLVEHFGGLHLLTLEH